MTCAGEAVQPYGVIRGNRGEDEQTCEEIEDLDTDLRPHRLIAPQEIIDATKEKLDNLRSNPPQP